MNPLRSILAIGLLAASSGLSADDPGLPETVSYYEHVRPVFQAKCQGCHQPAKAKSDYVMTDVARLIAGGETDKAVVPGHADQSFLIELVTTQEGEKRPEMPPKDDPLTDYERKLVSKWIDQGANDDTPENARQRYSRDNPPQYSVPPVITALDFSPDGKLLAVAGFHEVLLHKADGSGLQARLIGLSERIESVEFSPDGKQLLVAGGLPGRMGEIQVWDLEKNELDLSKIAGYDTAYGASWSPDGNLIAYGLPDNSVRAIKERNGDQVFFMGGHNDWVLGTDWSVKGDHLVSIGRDMTAKLSEVETERLIDNITSITPGALKGGLTAVDTHPTQDHILVGGADGVPQIYRMHRETVRKIGDNANLIRKYPAMEGRIWDVAFRPDGKRFAAVSSLDGHGEVALYRSEYDATITPELKKLFETARRNPDAEKNREAKIEEFQTKGAEQLASIAVDAPVFSLAFSPDGKTIAVGGDDGTVRLLDAAKLEEKTAFVPVKIEGAPPEPKSKADPISLAKGEHHPIKEQLPKGRKLVSLSLSPSKIALDSPGAYNQLLVTGTFANGETADLTRLVDYTVSKPEAAPNTGTKAKAKANPKAESSPIATISERGILHPLAEGTATLTVSHGNLETKAPLTISGLKTDLPPDFIRDVNPVISRLGCNTGTCHGAKDGKNGFKLSLRGYDPLFDVRAFGDDHTARRVNYASPDDSLMLLKATGAVPHEGGVVTEIGSDYYRTIRQWIANGAKLDPDSPKVARIEIFPKNPVIQNIGAKQQLRVVAHWSDGMTRDVTREAYIVSGNTEVAAHDDFGLLATIRRGEAPVLARFEGAYAATTLTVMGDREGFTWKEPETWGEIDNLVAAKWKRMKIAPSGLSSDENFVRRVHLDLTGLPPAAKRVKAFLADERPLRKKRDALVDELIGSPAFVEHWTNKWSDLLQVNSKFLGDEGARLFRDWIRNEVEANTPYDEFCRKILTASGSNKANPAASYYKILREPEAIMENTTHLFLATRFNCNKCHDHPFERWTQDQYYETAAWFARVGLDRDKKNASKANVGGSAVENAQPLYEIVSDKKEGEITHERTGEVQPPALPYQPQAAKAVRSAEKNSATGKGGNEKPTRREKLAAWITSPDNQYFASSYANRIWGYLLGTGIIEPLDDIRAGNPPSNPALLDHLTRRFIDSGFDARALMAEICKSRTYQLSIETNRWNEDDETNFSRAMARRLPAEVLYDSINFVVGTTPEIPGAKKGIRASQLADAKTDLKSGFLATLGRPVRESACECERSSDLQLSGVMAFLSGPTVADAIGAEDSELARLVQTQPDDKKLVEEIYYRVLGRAPGSAEVNAALESMSAIQKDHQVLVARAAKAEAEWTAARSELEITRHRAIAKAESDIRTYTPEHEKKKAKAEADREKRLATARAAHKERQKQLPQLVENFTKDVKAEQFWTQWRPLVPASATTSDKSETEILPDGSVRSTAGFKPRNLDYLVTGKLPAEKVTGIMIESIPDETFQGFGAGLNPNGNFVISEVTAKWKRDSAPKKALPLAFADAVADHNQNGFNVKNAINGKADRSVKGWALHGSNLQAPHRALLKFKEPVPGDPDGAALSIGIQCRYSNGDYPIGRFRLWYTTSSDPLRSGLPATVADALRTEPAARSEAQKKTLLAHVAENDEVLLKRKFAVAKEQRPLPRDQKMIALEQALKQAETPVETDRRVAQLRRDLAHSNEQAANRRLTAAQDLAWALINSPAFLFNR